MTTATYPCGNGMVKNFFLYLQTGYRSRVIVDTYCVSLCTKCVTFSQILEPKIKPFVFKFGAGRTKKSGVVIFQTIT